MEGRMGFRDFKCFNTTFLTKQLWRILMRPTSLVASILKEKYFRYNNLLEASMKGNSSWVWKSLIFVKDLLKEERIRWPVSNKEKIRIWRDKWLPSHNSFKIQSLIKNLNETTLAREFLEEGGKSWNIPFVLDSFWSKEAYSILSISVCQQKGWGG